METHLLIDLINELVGVTGGEMGSYVLDTSAAGYRLSRVTTTVGDVRDVSPLLSKAEFLAWLEAFIEGAQAGIDCMKASLARKDAV